METLLVDNVTFTAKRFTSSKTLLKCEFANHKSRVVNGNDTWTDYMEKVLKASNGKKYCIHINKNPADPDDQFKCMIVLHGFLTEDFETLWMEGLRVRIQISFSSHQNQATSSLGHKHTYFPRQMFAEIPIPKVLARSAIVENDNESCIKNGMILEAKDVSIRNWNGLFDLYFDPAYILGCASITLISDSIDFHPTDNDQLAVYNNASRAITHINRTILDSKLHSDATISSKDGSEFSCNKAFLAAHSNVLKAMLEADEETQTCKIEMSEITSDGVKALLQYLYTFDLDQASEKIEIALELLQAGHRYEISSLIKEISYLILNNEDDWLTVDLAFGLFLFTRKLESMKDVIMKAASILMKKSSEFIKCKAYMKEREKNLVEAADAVQELFCLLSLSSK